MKVNVSTVLNVRKAPTTEATDGVKQLANNVEVKVEYITVRKDINGFQWAKITAGSTSGWVVYSYLK